MSLGFDERDRDSIARDLESDDAEVLAHEWATSKSIHVESSPAQERDRQRPGHTAPQADSRAISRG